MGVPEERGGAKAGGAKVGGAKAGGLKKARAPVDPARTKLKGAARFTPEVAEALINAIEDAGKCEIFAIGDVSEIGMVTTIEVHARGTKDAVLALKSRPRAGQVVIHNHPSGNTAPSDADMQLASEFGEEGVWFIIIDNGCRKANWVVEPHQKKEVQVSAEELMELFQRRLPAIIPDFEPREGQLGMARQVMASINDGGVAVLEAGTGTGKSLAYLLPAALWAWKNDGKVLISTYTRTLQGQLTAEDLPLVAKLLPIRVAVLKGRNNYLCRRKLELLADDPAAAPLREWVAGNPSGERDDLPFAVEEDLWERVESDTDQTLRARCPHYNTCFYYQARRRAAAAHIIVVNHALLLVDRSLKRQAQKQGEGVGILPRYDRIMLDEAHHLEQATTSVAELRLSGHRISRTVGPLLNSRRRMGALEKLKQRWPVQLGGKADSTTDAILALKDHAFRLFMDLKARYDQPFRLPTGEEAHTPHAELFEALADAAEEGAQRLGAIEADLDKLPTKLEDMQPGLDVGRGRRRLEEVAETARNFLQHEESACRYFDPGATGVSAVKTPIDVGPTLQRLIQDLTTVVCTSATLAVHGRFEHYLKRLSFADDTITGVFPSPFQYRQQALLALPRDLPPPDAPGFMDEAARMIHAAVDASGGGAFVLCTSYAMVQELSGRLEVALGGRHAILVQGKGAKGRILEHFRKDRGAVLFGTDSFWEGVSVKGDGLRLVIIPKLPFRVPTEPVSQARYDRMRAQGLDPFRAWSLPEAVLKLRQGFGRLIRSTTDRGAVLMLDRRLHEMWYGRVFLDSLPDARRVVGPGHAVVAQLQMFFRSWSPAPGRSRP